MITHRLKMYSEGKMNHKNSLLLSLIGLALFFFTGCAAIVIGGAAGVGSYAYLSGELKSNEPIPLSSAWNATQKAVKESGFTVTSKEKDAFYAKLIARGAKDKKVTIKLKKQSDNITEIKIRVGMMGDEVMSRQIYEEIKKQIG